MVMLLCMCMLAEACICGIAGVIGIVLSIMTKDWKYMTKAIVPTVISIILIIVMIFCIQAG